MTQEEINKRNEAIALFMGIQSYNDDRYGKIYSIPVERGSIFSLKYNSSWNWLMPVVEKIAQKGVMVDIIIDTLKTRVEIAQCARQSTNSIEAFFLTVSDYCIAFNQSTDTK